MRRRTLRFYCEPRKGVLRPLGSSFPLNGTAALSGDKTVRGFACEHGVERIGEPVFFDPPRVVVIVNRAGISELSIPAENEDVRCTSCAVRFRYALVSIPEVRIQEPFCCARLSMFSKLSSAYATGSFGLIATNSAPRPL